MTVNTKLVKGRRRVRFSNYDEMLADVRALAQGPTRQLGNWSLGQVCTHLAKGMDTAIDGPSFSPPWFVRLLGPLMKKRMLTRGMAPGFQLPKYAAALLPPETSAAAGVAKLEKSVERVQREPARKSHIVFGKLSRDEWDAFLLRHAELHLSFLVPQSASARS